MPRFRLRFVRPRMRSAITLLALAGELPLLLLGTVLLRPWLGAAPAAALMLVLCVLLVVPLFFRLRRGLNAPAGRSLERLVIVFFAFWAASLVAGLAFVPLYLVALVFHFAGFHAAAAALGIGFAHGLAGVTYRRTRPRLRRVTLQIADLPPDLDGYRIAHLSDLHVGPHTPPHRVRRWIDRVNRLDVDLVAVTGDLITSGDTYVDSMARELGRLRAPDGVHLCLGNHEYFADTESLVRALEREGISVLRNRGVIAGDADRRLWVAGVDDTWSRRADVARAMAARPPDLFAVVLAHDPHLADRLDAAGADLILSGHTHGGQLAVPIFARTLNPARLAFRYTAGVYRLARSWLVVSRGAGTTGPPLRVGSPSEIPVLTLRVKSR